MTARTPESIIDGIRANVENETLRATLVDRLEELDVDAIREQVDRLEELACAIEGATEAVETWRDADDREERAVTKEDALEALDALVEAWDAVEGNEPEPEIPGPTEAELRATNLAWIAGASLADLELGMKSIDDPELLEAAAERRNTLGAVGVLLSPETFSPEIDESAS